MTNHHYSWLMFISLIGFIGDVGADNFVRDDINTEPDIHNFSMCHGYGCKNVEQLTLNQHEWQQIRRHFYPAAKSAEAEREQIANAIAQFEQIMGVKTNTSQDKAGVFSAMGSPGQLDCIDESTNTTIYLKLLYKQGLLKWHKPLEYVTRGFFIFGWPHSSATIKETQTAEGAEFVVDSWFEDNGKRPHIIPLSQWRSGWEPEQQKR